MQKIIFLLVGQPGCGKSAIANKIFVEVGKCGATARIISLDAIRMECNNGVYPVNKANHDMINKIAIPLYKENVKNCMDDFIILDNTHLRYDPDWIPAIEKCMKDGYDLFPVTPNLDHNSFFTNRSVHNVNDEIYFTMLLKFGGKRMGMFYNRIIRNNCIQYVFPETPESFKPSKIDVEKWGNGYLYFTGNYMGYIDKKMVDTVMKAGNYLREINQDEFFLRKNGPLHITLIKPSTNRKNWNRDTALKLMNQMKMLGEPPNLEYTGIQKLVFKVNHFCTRISDTEEGENVLLYLTISDKSQEKWKQILRKVTTIPMNENGLHVTLGYSVTDVYDIDKTSRPLFEIDENRWSALSEVYETQIRKEVNNETVNEVLSTKNRLTRILNASVQKVSENSESVIFEMPLNVREKMEMLMLHPQMKHKIRLYKGNSQWRRTYILSLSVFSGYKSDEQVYKTNPFIQKSVPRGLVHIFEELQFEGNKSRLEWIGCSFPTPKFFGDNDTDEGVDVDIGEDRENVVPKNARFVVTEKANGEMFTVSVLGGRCITTKENYGRMSYLLILGSKNNKFAFPLIVGVTTWEEIFNQINEYISRETQKPFNLCINKPLKDSEWCMQNVWVEMVLTMFEKLFHLIKLDASKIEYWLDWMATNRLTACGEFESWLHPHLETFEENHRVIRFFAVTSEDRMECEKVNFYTSIYRMNKMKDTGFTVVNSYTLDDGKEWTLSEIRASMMMRKKKEGIVLHVIHDEKVCAMVKIKTVWYVVHRGIREKLKKVLRQSEKGNDIDFKKLKINLKSTVTSKLQIFSLEGDNSLNEHYCKYVDSLVEYTEESLRTERKIYMWTFTYNYPKLIEKIQGFNK